MATVTAILMFGVIPTAIGCGTYLASDCPKKGGALALFTLAVMSIFWILPVPK